MEIVSNKVHSHPQMKMLYKAYYTSSEFQVSLINIFKLDPLYAQSDILFSSFEKVFSAENLEEQEYLVVKRVLSDEFVIESLAQTFSNKDYEVLLSNVKELPIDQVNHFHFPLEKFYEENKVVMMKYIIGELLIELKNQYMSVIARKSLADLEGIMSTQPILSPAELEALTQPVGEHSESLETVLINSGIEPPQIFTNKKLDDMCNGNASVEHIKK